MTGYADRLTLHDVRHGSLDGFAGGCRAELSCPARQAGGLSCLAVRIRYAGDWAYRRLVDAGVDVQAAAEQLDAADRAARVDAARAVRRTQRRSRARTTDHPTATRAAGSGALGASGRAA